MAAKGKTLKFFTAITLIVIVAFIAAPLAASCNILDRKPHYDFKPCKISKPHYGVSEKIPSIVLLEKHDFTRQTLGSNGCWLRQLHQTDQIIYSGPNIIAEYNAGTAATSPGNEYIYSGGIDSLTMVAFNNNAKRLAAVRNQQWSIVGLVDFDTQTLEEQYAYDVFGERTILDSSGTVLTSSAFNNRYGYTSREHDDEIGLMFFRARFYDPTTGEFISQDPLEYVDGMSTYRGYFVPNSLDSKGTKCKPPMNPGANYVPGRGAFVAGYPKSGDPATGKSPHGKPQNPNFIEPMWFDAKWKPNNRAFQDGNNCCCCDEISWSQIYKDRVKFTGIFGRFYSYETSWVYDGVLEYPGVTTRNPCTDPRSVRMNDQPSQFIQGAGITLDSWEIDFEACVYCKTGVEGVRHGTGETMLHVFSFDKLAVYGCASWGFKVERTRSGKYTVTRKPAKAIMPTQRHWSEAATRKGRRPLNIPLPSL